MCQSYRRGIVSHSLWNTNHTHNWKCEKWEQVIKLQIINFWIWPPVFCGICITRSLVKCVVFYRSLFTTVSFFLLSFVLAVLRFSDSDYPLGIFKLFLPDELIFLSCSFTSLYVGGIFMLLMNITLVLFVNKKGIFRYMSPLLCSVLFVHGTLRNKIKIRLEYFSLENSNLIYELTSLTICVLLWPVCFGYVVVINLVIMLLLTLPW